MRNCFFVLLAGFFTLQPELGFAWTVLAKTGGKAVLLRGKNEHDLRVGTRVQAGDVIATIDSRLKLVRGTSVIRIGENTSLTWKKENKSPDVLKITAGSSRIIIDSKEAKKFQFALPSAVAGVRGTDFYLKATSQKELICVLAGLVEVTDKETKKSFNVSGGQGWVREGTNPATVTSNNPEQVQKWILSTEIE